MEITSPRSRVCFRIFSPNLDPEDVSRNLGLSPDHSHYQGDYPQGKPTFTAYRHGMWLLRSKLPNEHSLETHLGDLLSILESKQSYIKALAQSATVDFSCTLYSQNGFQLSPQILSRIANLGAILGVVVYPGDSEVQLGAEEN